MQEINNNIKLIGVVDTSIEFNHELYGERFLEFKLKISRLSGTNDIIPIVISERILNEELNIGDIVEIEGEFHSYNVFDENEKSHLNLFGFVKEIKKLDYIYHTNEINLRGFIVKPPVYRETPLGRQITDLMIAVNRSYNKSDYIPCIVWGRNANYVKNFPIGTEIELNGRIQSREYLKKISEEESVEKTALEVSVKSLEIIN